MFNKKAQSQIITTVLIILLVLAAIVIVWQVVQGTVQQGADEIGGQSDCFTVGLEIEKLRFVSCNDVAGNEQTCNGLWDHDGDIDTDPIERVWTDAGVLVKRTPGGGDLRAISVLSDGEVVADSVDASSLNELETLEITADLVGNKVVEIAAIVGETNKLCGVADTAVA